ncbi:hypothetical protein GGTG_12654 [Gaeumannomyces tritici R3-111a-1]|uniref:Uncharacterized protein n=1 Tax=Gaeumannomyces tritici (strain R3-111a-1) TaxID=644352 RepID=J3PGM5_GAET3|nr:hypothetical protein GGTG_12654 [Gaeumannomyces tritici R3-111a-1]EJT69771.1 hypothetical protein GGTG_12654 [Gaeumannomyces tritici R3-111a-1]
MRAMMDSAEGDKRRRREHHLDIHTAEPGDAAPGCRQERHCPSAHITGAALEAEWEGTASGRSRRYGSLAVHRMVGFTPSQPGRHRGITFEANVMSAGASPR